MAEDREYNLDLGEDSYSTIFYISEKSASLPFFSYCSGRFCCNSGYYTINRRLEGYLILYTAAGCGLLEMENKKYTLDPQSVVLIDCKIPHAYKTLGDYWEVYYLRFSGTAAPLYYSMISTPQFRVLHYKNTFNIQTCLDHNINISFISGVKASFIQSKILTDLLTDIWLNCKSAEKLVDPAIRNLIDSVNQFIHKNYRFSITLDDIAQAVHLSPCYLSRLYKQYTGMALHESLLTHRINTAKNLLLSTDMHIQDIAYDVGFTNTNTFIRCFKKQMQMSPLNYKNTMGICKK